MVFKYDEPGPAQRRAFERWLGQSRAHAEAWTRAQAVYQTFEELPAGIGQKALGKLENAQRRRALKLLTMAAIAAPAGWVAWRSKAWQPWTADYATAAGEQQTLTLPDGSELVLNTASAVNLRFDEGARRIHLAAGEILVATHPSAADKHRPLQVDTRAGVVKALGTRFSVRALSGGRYQAAVFDKQVEIESLGGTTQRLRAGQQTEFSAARIGPLAPAENSDALWTRGMLVAKRMRLADVLAELGRHHHGILRCDPAVAHLEVSGALSLTDTDAALALLEDKLPIRISRVSAYWVTILPRH
jgi:transmembrane sensor